MILNSTSIRALLNNEEATKTFSFLRSAKSRLDMLNRNAKHCGSCNPSSTRNDIYRSVKQAIALLGPKQQAKFKALLGADTIQISYRVGLRIKTTTF